MVENWRVKIAISLSLTLPPLLLAVLPPAFSLIFVTRMARLRSSPTAAVRSCASISPVVVPLAPRPWYVKTAMSHSPDYRLPNGELPVRVVVGALGPDATSWDSSSGCMLRLSASSRLMCRF